MIFLESLTKEELPAEDSFLVCARSTMGFQPYKKLYEAVELFCGQYSFAAAKDLSEAMGPYQLDDVLSNKLRGEKIKVLEGGRLPHFSPLDYLDAALLQESTKKSFTVPEIENYCSALKLGLRSFTCNSDEKILVSKIYDKFIDDKAPGTTWKQLEIFTLVFAHKYPVLELELCRTRQRKDT